MGNQVARLTVWLRALSVVIVLTGQAPMSAHAGIYAGPAQNAAMWLESQQAKSDGSWRDSSESRTFLQTAEAVLALHQANRRNATYYAGQAWIENHDPQNLDARARRLLVLRATQSSAQQDIDALLAAVNTPAAGQSGWGLSKRYRSSPLDTALALDALRTAGATFSSAQAIAYLKSSQLTVSGDQGWAAATGTTTDAYTTARVVQALAAYKSSDTTLVVPLNNAVATLKTKVTASSAPHVRAAAALAYLRLDTASNDAKTLLNSLVTIQRPDGGFDSGVFATGLITQAFIAADGKDASTSRERVEVSDAALRTAINEALGRGAMDQLNRGELAELTSLDISNRGVTSLNGLQHAVNLTSLNASNNGITDTSPIAGLTNLTNTDISGNPCAEPGCGTQVASGDGDTPLPLWALGILGAALMGLIGRTGRRSDYGA
ncbi:hypothetical protein EIP75_00015 [Aquabacterium soli]|uniref:MYXO-CTERM domain-containing protein n=1 Tax=Aquabacterium soli TaxID=2493092 RepID=A0A426VGJ4_9BURK|nr:prenyltransferase/squalene oxidase repeat-containing protein [Aquabacterium soli]RRS06038.1 hypothetical protein EIP75_00015 [Aquabacterium soli]